MANEDPVMALLREIRDIQRSHAEWHRALSEQVAEEQRRRDEVAQRVAEATQAEVRKNQRDLKVLFVVFIVVLAIAGPLGNWIMHLAGR